MIITVKNSTFLHDVLSNPHRSRSVTSFSHALQFWVVTGNQGKKWSRTRARTYIHKHTHIHWLKTKTTVREKKTWFWATYAHSSHTSFSCKWGTLRPTFGTFAGGFFLRQVAFGQPLGPFGMTVYLEHLSQFISASFFGGGHFMHRIVGHPQTSLPTDVISSPYAKKINFIILLICFDLFTSPFFSLLSYLLSVSLCFLPMER